MRVRRMVLAAAMAALTMLPLVAQPTSSAFSAVITTASNTFASATSFCTATDAVWMNGMESGVFSVTGGGLFSGHLEDAGQTEADAVVKRNGSYSLKVTDASSTAASYARVAMAPSTTVVVARFAVRLDALPAANLFRLSDMDVADSSDMMIGFEQTSGKPRARFGSGTWALGTTSLTAATWHLVDVRVNVGVNPRTLDWRINGVAQPQATFTASPSTVTDVRFSGNGNNSDIFTANFDDMMISTTSADYPIGDGNILALAPDAMGSSVNPGNFTANSAGVIDASSWSYVSGAPMDGDEPDGGAGSNNLRQAVNSTTSYLELTLSGTAETGCVQAVGGIIEYRSVDATANDGTTKLYDGTGELTVYSGPMNPGSTNRTYKAGIAVPADDRWSQSELNALTMRIGYCAACATNRPRWEAVRVEYSVAP